MTTRILMAAILGIAVSAAAASAQNKATTPKTAATVSYTHLTLPTILRV